jgi:hypothetical protein
MYYYKLYPDIFEISSLSLYRKLLVRPELSFSSYFGWDTFFTHRPVLFSSESAFDQAIAAYNNRRVRCHYDCYDKPILSRTTREYFFKILKTPREASIISINAPKFFKSLFD